MFTIKPATFTLPPLPDVDFFPEFMSAQDATDYMAKLMEELEFKAETYTFQDNEIQTKRKISYHSELAYTYSKQVYSGKAWTPTLLELKKRVEEYTQHEFNAVLCNHYENGEAGMGWHADKEKELGDNPVIASLSFGQERRFAFRHRREVVNLKNPPRLSEYELGSGNLLVMKGMTQRFFEHCVVKDKSATGVRINLTFRKVVM